MLVSSKEILKKARKGKYAVPHCNTSTLEITRAIVRVAKKMDSPIILATSEGEVSYLEPYSLIALVKILSREIGIDLVVHLDHAKNIEIVRSCLKAGYTSIHIDGSEKPYEENVALTEAVVNLAKETEASVEGELGQIESHYYKSSGQTKLDGSIFTDPTMVDNFVTRTKIDSLAISVGTIHGAYKGETKIDFERLREISQATDLPLVLHGASLVKEEDLKKAISFGVSKFNFNTELRLAFTNTLKKILSEKPEEYVPYKFLPTVIQAVEKVVEEKIRFCGSGGKL